MIKSPVELDVTLVYTAGKCAATETLEVETIQPRFIGALDPG